jgi:hypothetical protein
LPLDGCTHRFEYVFLSHEDPNTIEQLNVVFSSKQLPVLFGYYRLESQREPKREILKYMPETVRKENKFHHASRSESRLF